MTVGKDVTNLFTDVVNCMMTENLELKKLVYLYLINYAKSQPEQALLSVNSFIKDANDPNPLIRALAIRTMGTTPRTHSHFLFLSISLSILPRIYIYLHLCALPDTRSPPLRNHLTM